MSKLLRTQEETPKAGRGTDTNQTDTNQRKPTPQPPPSRCCLGSGMGGSPAGCVAVWCGDGVPCSHLSTRLGPPHPSPLDLQSQRGGEPGALRSHLASVGLFPSWKVGRSLLARPLPGRKEIQGTQKRESECSQVLSSPGSERLTQREVSSLRQCPAWRSPLTSLGEPHSSLNIHALPISPSPGASYTAFLGSLPQTKSCFKNKNSKQTKPSVYYYVCVITKIF